MQLKLSMPRSANLWKVIHCLIKEDSLVAPKLRDQATAPDSDSSKRNARETMRDRRKAELYSLGSRYRERCLSRPGWIWLGPITMTPPNWGWIM